MRKLDIENGAKVWYFSSSQYVQSDFKNIEDQLKEKYMKLPLKENPSISNSDFLYINVSLELVQRDDAYYQ